MTCQIVEEEILDGALSAAAAAHLATCTGCRQFREAQLRLDGALATHFQPPELSPAFRSRLNQRVNAEKRKAWRDLIPDMLHWSGGIVTTALLAWMLPAEAGAVLAWGAGATMATWGLHAALRFVFEVLEDETR